MVKADVNVNDTLYSDLVDFINTEEAVNRSRQLQNGYRKDKRNQVGHDVLYSKYVLYGEIVAGFQEFYIVRTNGPKSEDQGIYVLVRQAGVLAPKDLSTVTGNVALVVTDVVPVPYTKADGSEGKLLLTLGTKQEADELIGYYIQSQLQRNEANPIQVSGVVKSLQNREDITTAIVVARTNTNIPFEVMVNARYLVDYQTYGPVQLEDVLKKRSIVSFGIVNVKMKPFVPADDKPWQQGRNGLVAMYQTSRLPDRQLEVRREKLDRWMRSKMRKQFVVAKVESSRQEPLVAVFPDVFFLTSRETRNGDVAKATFIKGDEGITKVWGYIEDYRVEKSGNRELIKGRVKITGLVNGTAFERS
ncbi:hypothetical protein ESZ50_02630 [Weissella muntiaci]|uniref:Uncharacterized protein n=1 Tax=Weissella muntiaci TaxID=2508881 RepID=A0A6C2CBX5_9LACO|nr:hypothetical protein [Weissella muntiaci]TYC50585.1 hypothetical protein ESZ50_02630 [Weissella muntiaci]